MDRKQLPAANLVGALPILASFYPARNLPAAISLYGLARSTGRPKPD